MNNKDKLSELLLNSKYKIKEKSELMINTFHLFDFEIIDSIDNDKTDFMFNDFKHLQETIKSVIKVDNLYENLERFKQKLKDSNIDYKSTFFVRVKTS
jgi:hypothetical protein